MANEIVKYENRLNHIPLRKFWTKATLRSKLEIADKLELIGAEFKKINPNFRGSADNE